MNADPATHASRAALIGIIMVVTASLFWSLNGALIKLINQGGEGPSGVTIAFYRSLVAGLFLLPIAWRRCRTKPGAARVLTRPAAIWCVLFFTIMTACFVMANTMTQAASVIILQYTSTFWIFGLSPLVLKEKPRSSDLWILGLALIGVMVMVLGPSVWAALNGATQAADANDSNTSAASSGAVAGMAVALASGFFYALLTLMIRRLRDADLATVTVMNNLGSAVLLLPLVVGLAGLSLSTRSFWLLVFMGIVQFGIPYYLYALALARIPAYQTAILTLMEPVLVPVWACMFIGRSEIPSVWTIAGGGVILFALVLFLLAARRASREQNLRSMQATPATSTATVRERG
jgi:drug/metabolite transporter (DMT)-like permease